VKPKPSVLWAFARKNNAATCRTAWTRLDAPDGWNFLMRVYRPGKSVLSGSYKLPDAVPFKK